MANRKMKKSKSARPRGRLPVPLKTEPWNAPPSKATTARYAFACPSTKEGEGYGIHVSMIPQTEQPAKLNFFMDADTAIRLRNALTESLNEISRHETHL